LPFDFVKKSTLHRLVHFPSPKPHTIPLTFHLMLHLCASCHHFPLFFPLVMGCFTIQTAWQRNARKNKTPQRSLRSGANLTPQFHFFSCLTANDRWSGNLLVNDPRRSRLSKEKNNLFAAGPRTSIQTKSSHSSQSLTRNLGEHHLGDQKLYISFLDISNETIAYYRFHSPTRQPAAPVDCLRWITFWTQMVTKTMLI